MCVRYDPPPGAGRLTFYGLALLYAGIAMAGGVAVLAAWNRLAKQDGDDRSPRRLALDQIYRTRTALGLSGLAGLGCAAIGSVTVPVVGGAALAVVLIAQFLVRARLVELAETLGTAPNG